MMIFRKNKKGDVDPIGVIIGIIILLALMTIIFYKFFPSILGLSGTAVSSTSCKAQIGLAKGFCTNDTSSCEVSRPADSDECGTTTHCCYNSDGANPNAITTPDKNGAVG